MIIRQIFGGSVFAALVLASAPAVAAFPITFDDPVTVGAAQAADTWYTDRFAPAGFVSQVDLLGDNRLRQSISAADGANNRPSNFSGTFYNTQGRKLDLPGGVTFGSIDLFVPQDWASTDRRMAGFWATAVTASDVISFFPIIEFTSAEGPARFRAWNGNGFDDLGLPTGFAYDSFTTLAFQLNGSNIDYRVGDLTLSLDNGGSTRFDNIILQGYNNAAGVTYDIHWDNVRTAAVPEPASWVMLIVGFGLVGARLRRRRAVFG